MQNTQFETPLAETHFLRGCAFSQARAVFGSTGGPTAMRDAASRSPAVHILEDGQASLSSSPLYRNTSPEWVTPAGGCAHGELKQTLLHIPVGPAQPFALGRKTPNCISLTPPHRRRKQHPNRTASCIACIPRPLLSRATPPTTRACWPLAPSQFRVSCSQNTSSERQLLTYNARRVPVNRQSSNKDCKRRRSWLPNTAGRQQGGSNYSGEHRASKSRLPLLQRPSATHLLLKHRWPMRGCLPIQSVAQAPTPQNSTFKPTNVCEY